MNAVSTSKAACRLNARLLISPRTAAPLMFTVSVPNGKERAIRRATAPSKTNRSTAPMPPATSTPSQTIISAALPRKRGDPHRSSLHRRRRASAHPDLADHGGGQVHCEQPQRDAGGGVADGQAV